MNSGNGLVRGIITLSSSSNRSVQSFCNDTEGLMDADHRFGKMGDIIF